MVKYHPLDRAASTWRFPRACGHLLDVSIYSTVPLGNYTDTVCKTEDHHFHAHCVIFGGHYKPHIGRMHCICRCLFWSFLYSSTSGSNAGAELEKAAIQMFDLCPWNARRFSQTLMQLHWPFNLCAFTMKIAEFGQCCEQLLKYARPKRFAIDIAVNNFLLLYYRS